MSFIICSRIHGFLYDQHHDYDSSVAFPTRNTIRILMKDLNLLVSDIIFFSFGICQCIEMLQSTDDEASLSSSTQPATEIEGEGEGDRSSSSGLSVYASEDVGHVGNDFDGPIFHKRAHAHGVISTYYPRRADISTSRSVTHTGVADVLELADTLFSTQHPAIFFCQVGNCGLSFSIIGQSGTTDILHISTQVSSTITRETDTIAPTTSVVSTTSITVLTSTLSSSQWRTVPETYTPTPSPQLQTTSERLTTTPESLTATPESHTTASGSLTATSESHTPTSGSHPMASQTHTPSLGIIAGSAAGGAAVLIAVILMAFCVVRRRSRRNGNRRAYNENQIVHSDSNSNSSSQVNLETSHEHEGLVMIPIDHDDEIKAPASAPPSTVGVPLSTTAIVPSVPVSNTLPTSLPRSTGLPTSPPGEPVPVASANLRLDSGSCSDPYPHSDYCSVHEADHPCPSYSCISLTENNYSIGSISRRRAGRDGSEGRGRQVEGDGDGQGRTRGRGARGRSRSSSRPIVRRMNIPSRSTARARAVLSDRSVETAPPPSYDFANQ
ncbi:hypothetical protein BJ138DRAFT_1129355 [Hygrophoropsis aurantiaca]|uniref:Uncharacterized protein n=1 Tax=Hygrophoropsis aurantiaca TaxID=72124 RepID=A0ACB8A1S2_9AGAM|nr:hypothetical protein BJ138DRAFT_1129355 [Hygrophoropsis aurantiaca]